MGRSLDSLPLTFKVGGGDVVAGLDAAIRRVSLGGLAELTIPSIYAYANKGLKPEVPPNSVLVMSVQLIRMKTQSGLVLIAARA